MNPRRGGRSIYLTSVLARGILRPRSLMNVGVMLLLLVAVTARAAQPHVRHTALPIWCDGIGDAVSDPFWGIAQSKNQDVASLMKARVCTIRTGAQLDRARVCAVDQRDKGPRRDSLLFRPRLFTAAAPNSSDSANPH